MMSVNKQQQQQQQQQQLLQQKGCVSNKDGLFIRWTMCMTSSFIGICCISILWLRYWLPAYEYRTCLADGLHEGFIDAATYAEYWLPKTVTPCAAGVEILSEQYIQQMGMLPVTDYYAFIDAANRRFIQPLHDKQQFNMPDNANRYAAWCQSITLNQCDPYYLHLIYTAVICFTCTICCLYSILTFNIYKEDNNNSFLPPNFKFRPICRKFKTCGKYKNIFTSKLEMIREVEEPLEIDF